MLQIDVLQQPTHYELLQVTPFAEHVEIKSAYRRLSRLYHPDNRSQHADQRLQQQLNAAWEVLGDPLSRAQYDRQQAIQRSPRLRHKGFSDTQHRRDAEQMRRSQADKARREAEYRRAEAERLEREEAERVARAERARLAFRLEREVEERVRLEQMRDRSLQQRILREQRIRSATLFDERAGSAESEACCEARSADRQTAAEQAVTQLRERRYQLIIAPARPLK